MCETMTNKAVSEDSSDEREKKQQLAGALLSALRWYALNPVKHKDDDDALYTIVQQLSELFADLNTT